DDPPGCGTPGGSEPGPGPGPGPGPDPTAVPPDPPLAAGLFGWLAQDAPGAGDQPGPGPGDPTATPKGGVGANDEPAGSEDLIRGVQQQIREILDRQEITRDVQRGKLRVGLAQFNDRGSKLVDLTDDIQRVRTRVGSLKGGGHSRIDLGMRIVQTMFSQRDRNGRIVNDNSRVKILVILSDGLYCRRDLRLTGQAASEIKVVTMAAGRGADTRKLRQLTSEAQYALKLGDTMEFMHLYNAVLPIGRQVTLTALTVRDELAGNMALVPGSVQPPTVTITGQLLEWALPPPVRSPLTLTYQIQPQEAGLWPISAAASASWTDSEGMNGSAPFPNVEIDVIAPTPTPTNTSTPTDTPTPTPTFTPTPTDTPTATPTATPTPAPGYLPITYRLWPEPTPTATPCVPADQVVDIAVVIDTSNSMSDPTPGSAVRKIDAAIGAAKGLVNLLLPAGRLTQAQVTVIWFNGQSNAAIPLSGDRAAVLAALDSLPATQAGGTRIDLGLQKGREMLGATTRLTARQSLILVTDGEQEASQQPLVIAAADAIKAARTELFAIALGADADQVLLRQVATDAAHFVYAPGAEDLQAIYTEIGAVIPCR
ncbi:hypothetical protein DCC79_09860, partial [bacterium]